MDGNSNEPDMRGSSNTLATAALIDITPPIVTAGAELVPSTIEDPISTENAT